jgi:uncharacterized protein (DUF362 family)
MQKVALVKGDVRYDNVFKSLELVFSEVESIVSKSYRIVVLPDFLYTKNETTVVHVDAVRAILDFITQFTNKTVTIAGSSFSIADFFSDFHYMRLQDSYSVRLVDLYKDKLVPLRNIGVDVSKTLLDSDCRISVGLLHTHNILLANLSLSQFLLSAISLTGKKELMQDPKIAHLTISALSKKLLPHFSVIDGFAGIQGDFPLSTDIVRPVNVAIAGNNPLAVDAVAAAVMGIRAAQIAYLRRSKGKLNNLSIKVIGDKINSCRKKFVLPSNSRNLVSL